MDGSEFDAVLDFWENDGPTCDTIQNERQHTALNHLLFGACKHFSRQDVGQLFHQQFSRVLRREHLIRFGQRGKAQSWSKRVGQFKASLNTLKQLVGKRRKKQVDSDTGIKAMNSASAEYVRQHLQLKKLAWLASRKGSKRDSYWSREDYNRQRAALHLQFKNLPSEEQEPYIRDVRGAQEGRRTIRGDRVLQDLPLPQVADDGDHDPARLEAVPESLLECGNRFFPVAPKTVQLMLKECVRKSSIEALCKEISEADNPDSLSSFIAPTNTSLNQPVLGKWLSEIKSCNGMHVGLCSTQDKDNYLWILFRGKTLNDVLNDVKPEQEGDLLYLFHEVLPSTRPIPYRRFAFLSRVVRSPQWQVFHMCIETAANTVTVQLPYNLCSSFSILRDMCTFEGTSVVSEVAYEKANGEIKVTKLIKTVALPPRSALELLKIPKDADAVAPMADSYEEITQAFHKLKDRVRVEGPQQVDDSSDSEGSSNAVAPDRSKDKAADKKFAAELRSMDSLTRLSLPKPKYIKKRKVRKPPILPKPRANGTDFFISYVRIGFTSGLGRIVAEYQN